MSAEILRAAAKLMCERAALCPPNARVGTVTWASEFSTRVHAPGQHFTPWQPHVVAAVADWLESVAGALTPPPPESPLGIVDAGRVIADKDADHALIIARAYLGEAS